MFKYDKLLTEDEALVTYIEEKLNYTQVIPDDLEIPLPPPRQQGLWVEGLRIELLESELDRTPYACNICEIIFNSAKDHEAHMNNGLHHGQASEWSKDYRTVPNPKAGGWQIEHRQSSGEIETISTILQTRLLALFTIGQLRRRDIGLPYNLDRDAPRLVIKVKPQTETK